MQQCWSASRLAAGSVWTCASSILGRVCNKGSLAHVWAKRGPACARESALWPDIDLNPSEGMFMRACSMRKYTPAATSCLSSISVQEPCYDALMHYSACTSVTTTLEPCMTPLSALDASMVTTIRFTVVFASKMLVIDMDGFCTPEPYSSEERCGLSKLLNGPAPEAMRAPTKLYTLLEYRYMYAIPSMMYKPRTEKTRWPAALTVTGCMSDTEHVVFCRNSLLAERKFTLATRFCSVTLMSRVASHRVMHVVCALAT